jgi:NAD(P)H dehydrogenase (quinone)
MNVLVILAHPHPGSFNHAIAGVVIETLRDRGHQVSYHDLYKEKFDPVLPRGEIPKEGTVDPVIKTHCGELQTCGGIVVIHPNWWGQPPAILKGWVDRVIRPGIAYEFQEGDGGEGVPLGLLAGKVALVFNTSNTPDEREKTVFGDPLERLWKNCVFDFCGISVFYRRMFNVMVTSTAAERGQWLSDIKGIMQIYFR